MSTNLKSPTKLQTQSYTGFTVFAPRVIENRTFGKNLNTWNTWCKPDN